jgi:GTPase
MSFMSVPKVVIVGRPNVGKSSLMNWLANKRISVVEPTAGVTRDRVTHMLHAADRYFELVDTGGIGIVDKDDLSADIDRQIQIGLDEAHLVVFVVDGAAGVVPLDIEVANRLRKIGKPVLLVVNKCDSPRLDAEAPAFLGLSTGPYLCTSVKGERNREALLEAILRNLPEAWPEEADEGDKQTAEPELKLAIVGRRNAGKSTFINALAEQERMIVSEIAGTTRDAVDVRFERDGKSFLAIDTPGVRKRKSLENDIEVYGMFRAKRSIRRATVVLMFFDAAQEVSSVDKQLVQYICDEYKPCIFVVNKWDLGKKQGMTSERWGEYLSLQFPTLSYFPVAFVTAKDSVNIRQVVNLAQNIAKQNRIRVSTSKINAVLRAAVLANRPPMRAQRQPKVFYGTQVATEPATIVLKCNHPELVDRSWQRFLLNVLRDKLPFREVPIKLYLRGRTKDESHASSVEEWDENDPRLQETEDGEQLPGFEGSLLDEFEREEYEDGVADEASLEIDDDDLEAAPDVKP